MKKLGLFVLSLVVVGCSSTKAKANYRDSISQEPMVDKVKDEPFKQPPKNKNCIYNITNVDIFQTLDTNYGLATYNRGEQYYETALFQLPYSFLDTIKLYDGLRIEVPEGQCFTITDTYKYTSKGAGIKVVPIITFEYEYEPRNEEELQQRLDKEMRNIRQNACIFENKNDMTKQGFKSLEHCQCYIDTMLSLEFLTEIDLSNKIDPKIDGFIKGFKNAEQQCGKLLTTTNKPNKTKKVVNKK